MRYFVSGIITYTMDVYVEHEIEADSPERAVERAKRHIIDTRTVELIEPQRAKYLKDNLTAIEDVWLAPDSENL